MNQDEKLEYWEDPEYWERLGKKKDIWYESGGDLSTYYYNSLNYRYKRKKVKRV